VLAARPRWSCEKARSARESRYRTATRQGSRPAFFAFARSPAPRPRSNHPLFSTLSRPQPSGASASDSREKKFPHAPIQSDKCQHSVSPKCQNPRVSR